MMIRYAHTNIVSKNWKALVDFYINTFECELIPPIRSQSGEWLEQGTGLNNAALEGAHLHLPGHGPKGPTLEIYQYQSIEDLPALPPNSRGFGHISFEVDNVVQISNRIMENGGSLNGEVTTKDVKGVGELTFVYARDPEGNLIEIQAWN